METMTKLISISFMIELIDSSQMIITLGCFIVHHTGDKNKTLPPASKAQNTSTSLPWTIKQNVSMTDSIQNKKVMLDLRIRRKKYIR